MDDAPQQQEPDQSSGEEVIVPPREDRMLPWLATLSSAGIGYRVERGPQGWEIHVPEELAPAARRELAEYERVNTAWPPRPHPPEDRPLLYDVKGMEGGLPGLLLLFAYRNTGPFAPDLRVFARGGADAAAIAAGEWWRAGTALMLHADLPHVLGNSVCWAFFGAAVCRQIGLGAGWLAVLLTGFLGNLVTALLTGPGRVAIGGSTASFGALGLLSIFQVVRNYRRFGSLRSVWNRTWVPFAAATALLAILGSGARADLTGHLAGFAAGLILGLAALPLLTRRIGGLIQALLGLAAAAGLATVWYLALGGAAPP